MTVKAIIKELLNVSKKAENELIYADTEVDREYYNGMLVAFGLILEFIETGNHIQ